MRKLFLFVIALGLILEGCGGGLEMTMKPGKGFKVKSSVEVESNGFDPASLQQRIERALFENGVNVESPSLTQGESVLQHDISQAGSPSPGKTTDSVSAVSTAANGREKGHVYLLEFSYESNLTFSGVVIRDFTATVYNAGEIVGMIGYHGGQMTPEKLADDVGKKLAQELK